MVQVTTRCDIQFVSYKHFCKLLVIYFFNAYCTNCYYCFVEPQLEKLLAYQAEIWPGHTFGLLDYKYIFKNAQLCQVFADPVTHLVVIPLMLQVERFNSAGTFVL